MRKLLEKGSYDFTFSDNTVPTTEAHEAMVHKTASPQILRLNPLTKANAAERLAAKKEREARPVQLQAPSQIRLGLADNVMRISARPIRLAADPQKHVRADSMGDVLVKGHYLLQ